MKKILCPVDFSAASKNGMEYASRLAEALPASLTILYVRTSIWPEAIQLEKEGMESEETIVEWLSVFVKEVKKEFRIQCDFYLEETTKTFEETVSLRSINYDLVVIGTNGADSFYQYVFGSNSFHVMERSKCPVIIVPEGFRYRSIKLMVYAYDPESNRVFLIEQLKKLMTPLSTEVRVLYIKEGKASKESAQKMEILKNQVEAKKPNDISWSFDFEYSLDIAFSLTNYMTERNGDLLALSFHHRSLMGNLFKENVLKRISMIADYPVFVFWH